MGLDINTLFLLTMYIEAILGLLLFLAWVQNLGSRAMAWWGSAHLMRSLSVALYGMYGAVPDIVSIDLAGALLFISFGVTWSGARVFNQRAPMPAWLLMGAAVWLAAGHLPGVGDNNTIRNLLSACIVAAFSWAAAYELWHRGSANLFSRWPAIVLLFAHGVLFLLRAPFIHLLPSKSLEPPLSTAWLTILSPEALLFSIAIAFVLLALGKERTELTHKSLALLDPLTGLANRRGFMQDAEIITRNQVLRGNPVAVFIADLDHFKAVNDTYGHAAGDCALRVFGEVCRDNLRSTDLCGRIGGEEFAILLADANRDNAFLVAERLRSAFENRARMIEGVAVCATISMGVAIIEDPGQDLTALLANADQALYRAKERGRNRVELAPLTASERLEEATELRQMARHVRA